MPKSGEAQNGKPNVLVVVQLSGGNDFMNTVVPYTNPLYHDFRKTTGIAEDKALPIDDTYGFHPAMGQFKQLWDEVCLELGSTD